MDWIVNGKRPLGESANPVTLAAFSPFASFNLALLDRLGRS